MNQLIRINGKDYGIETVETPRGSVVVASDFDLRTHTGTVHEIFDMDAYRVQELQGAGFKPARVIDVGAQNGVFTRLCALLWPEVEIMSFEPVLETFRCLALNATSRCTLYNLPVLGTCVPRIEGNIDEERWFRENHYFPALRLPPAQVLKLDCEGGEINILRDLHSQGRIKDFDIIVGEWHFGEAKNLIKAILPETHVLQIAEAGNWNLFFASKKGFNTR